MFIILGILLGRIIVLCMNVYNEYEEERRKK